MRVFLSSTCYGLADLRAALELRLKELGHSAMLSDRETFPVTAGTHRHDCCLDEAGKADLVLLVIDKAFGAPYYKDPSISITWAEVRAALAAGVPVFVFVRRSIFDERMSYLKNTKAGNAFSPFFCDKTATFDFISELQSKTGVWMQWFDDVTNIYSHLTRIKELLAGGPAHFAVGPAIPVTQGRISTACLSAEVREYLNGYGSVPASSTEVALADLQKVAEYIPTGSQYVGILMDFELGGPADAAPWYHSAIRPAEDDGSSWFAARLPTTHGLQLKREIEDVLRRAGYPTAVP